MMSFFFYTSLFFFILLCLITCLVVLVQESKSMGLGASFGGDPGESLFGTSTASILKKFTAYLGVVFIISCLLLSIWSESIARTRRAPEIEMEEVQD